MKLKTLTLLAIGLTSISNAQTTVNFPDATVDLGTNIGFNPQLDISSVDVTLDAGGNNLTFTINLNGDPVATNWGKYLIGIRSGTGGTASGNGWGRPINFASGMTHWIGGWADYGGGVGLYKYQGASWNVIKGSFDAVDPLPIPVITSSSYSVTIPVALLDYTPGPGQTVTFDVYASGSSGGAVDALSVASASINDWNDSFTTTTPLSFPASALAPGGDEDADGYLNGAETDGTSALGYVSNPYIPNFTQITVAGDFNGFAAAPNGSNQMTQVDTSNLTDQYLWNLDFRFTTPATTIAYKFTSGAYQPTGTDWGSGGGNSVLANAGGDIPAFVGPSGIYRFSFDQASLTRTFGRRSFDDDSAFLAAYGLSATPSGDADGDGILNQAEFTDNTDPLRNDTDGDGILDGADSLPLTPVRDVTFRVDMSVQIAGGFYTPENSMPRLLIFGGPIANSDPVNGDHVMSLLANNVYEVTVTNVPGFAGFNLEAYGYKFFNSDPNAPTYGYEMIGSDPNTGRTLTLGAAGTLQVMPTVYFSNAAPLSAFATWSNVNAGGGAFDADFDGDGIKNGLEYFFGEVGSTPTSNPVPNASRLVSWPRDVDATGVSFKVWSSETLAAGSWLDVTGSADIISDPNFVKYTLPTATKVFVRLEVTEN